MYKVTIKTGDDETLISAPTASGLKLSSGVIERKLNAIDSFAFSFNPSNPAWGNIYGLKTMVTVENTRTGKVEFAGRALTPKATMTESGEFTMNVLCEGKLGYLHDTIQRYGEYHNLTPAEYLELILAQHNAQTDESKRIYMGKSDVTNSTDNLYRYLSYDDTWQSITDDLVSSLGGYLFLRDEGEELYLDYLSESGSEQTMSIELTKNMKAVESEWAYDGVITKLIPLGEQIESVSLAIERLTAAGVITDPAWWNSNYRNLEWVGQLLINMARLAYNPAHSNGISAPLEAISFLSNAGVIFTPEYWIENHDKMINLNTLLIITANMHDPYAENTKYVSASLPRLTIAGVNDGLDYILDTRLVAEYGIIEGTVIWDDVTQPENLMAKGKAWLEAQTASEAITLSALNLHLIDESYDDFVLGNYYRPNNTVLRLVENYYQLTEQTINIFEPQESALVFGTRPLSLSGHIALGGNKG